MHLLLQLYLSIFLIIFVNSALANSALPLTEDEISHLSIKYQPLFSPGGQAGNLSSGDRLSRILEDLEERLSLKSLVPEASQLDDVHWEDVEKCYDTGLLTDYAKGSVNLFNSTLKRVLNKYFDFHLDLLEDGQSSTILRRLNALLSNIYFLAKETIECIRGVREGRGYEPTRLGLTPFAAYTDEEFEEKFLMKESVLGSLGWDWNDDDDDNKHKDWANDPWRSGSLDENDDNTETLNQANVDPGRRRRTRRPWKRPTRRPRPGPRPNKASCKVTVPQSKWPNKYDWRDYKLSGGRSYSVVTPVKQQGGCGSCYVFAATAAMESAFMLSNENKEKEQTQFSEQALLNCANGGCGGGFETQVWRLAQQRGVTVAANAAYAGRPQECKQFQSKARPTSYCQNSRLKSDADIMGVVYQFGPSVVAIRSSDRAFKMLKGTWNQDCSKGRVDHVITAVGYTDKTFIFKNSWGKGWGVGGYLVMKRDNTNRCGIYTEVGLPFFLNQDKGYNV